MGLIDTVNFGEPEESPYAATIKRDGRTWWRYETGPVYSQRKPADFSQTVVLVATGGSVFHVPVLHHFTYEHLKTMSWGNTTTKAPILIEAGREYHLRPYCCHQFWSPFWNLVTVQSLKDIAGLFSGGFRMCKNCGWFLLGAEITQYIRDELLKQPGSHFMGHRGGRQF